MFCEMSHQIAQSSPVVGGGSQGGKILVWTKKQGFIRIFYRKRTDFLADRRGFRKPYSTLAR
jgi:hypothetical protein